MRYILLGVLLLLLAAGCESSVAPTTFCSTPNLSDEKKEEIKELVKDGNEFYAIHKISEVDGLIETQLLLTFNPVSFNEVMPLTGPLAEAVAALFDHKVPVTVVAIFTIAGSDTEMVFGESIFVPETGNIEYMHFGRNHVMRSGDP